MFLISNKEMIVASAEAGVARLHALAQRAHERELYSRSLARRRQALEGFGKRKRPGGCPPGLLYFSSAL
jgi:hypothetical protein